MKPAVDVNNEKNRNSDLNSKKKSRDGNSPKVRSGFTVCMKLIGLVKPLTGFMVGAVTMGLAGHLCASFITIFAGYALLSYCLLYTSPSPRDGLLSRMPSSA